MKKFLLSIIALVFVAASATYAQTTEAPATKPQPSTEWKEKNEFHKVIAQTFHPMEEGNYEPIRKRSAELFDKAMAWQNSQIPAEFNTEEVKKTLRVLVMQTRELNAKILAGTTNEVINTELTKVHDTFHQIVGLCKPGDHHDHGHGHEGHNH